MRVSVGSAATLEGQNHDFVGVAVTKPFDRAAADLGVPLVGGEALVAEASRVCFDGELADSVTAQAGGVWYALIGAGPSPKPADYRRVGSKAVALARKAKVSSGALVGAKSAARARFSAEGAHLTGYAFDKYQAPTKSKSPRLKSFLVIASHDAAVRSGVDAAEAVCVARDLANEHPGTCTPNFLAQRAEEIATQYGFECKIRDEDELAAENFNLLLAVGRGSDEPSRLIHLTYRPEGEVKRTICLVGKGVTYDSGGYSIKPSPHQVNMHLDMGGSAAVLGAAEAVGRAKPPGVVVHFIVPTAENLVSGNAYKLNEIVTGYAGISVEVLNTDAEGRLILADALAYAVSLNPDEIIDLATLTGACVVALGNETAGVWSNDEEMAGRLLGAAEGADEAMWRMPLTERITDQLKSDFADTKNIGSRWGGAISAALFLRKFVGDTPWAHIDIAGPGMTEQSWEYINKGGTGFGVLALLEYCTRSGE
jgi:leucyl aminopeptidase